MAASPKKVRFIFLAIKEEEGLAGEKNRRN
jgi:hypothetical protein